MSDRSIRNLSHLQSSASTARVLNLLSVWKQHGHTEEWAAAPMFRNTSLNRCWVIKHRLRRNELDLFRSRRQVATKVLLPIEATDLKLGGRFVFVDQIDFERSLKATFGSSFDDRDLETLRLLDKLPSLDPFLLREQLKRYGVEPARCYFEVADADLKKMFAFVESEIRPLVNMSLGAGSDEPGSVGAHATTNLVSKILSNAGGPEMEPLRMTLRLQPDEYAEGVFCWKGFLYYKWAVANVLKHVSVVAEEVAMIKPVGAMDSEAKAYIERGRKVLRHLILKTCDSVIDTLRVYDDAYANLTQNGRPTAFREFLLDAPHMFTRLGEQVGAVEHILSFWRFRFGPNAAKVSVEELIDILMDFEGSLAPRDQDGRRAA
ncbi:hypothetical protein BH09PSE1_BH09PSE1_10650 [soil metagenome]